jgi:hypothetical protein
VRAPSSFRCADARPRRRSIQLALPSCAGRAARGQCHDCVRQKSVTRVGCPRTGYVIEKASTHILESTLAHQRNAIRLEWLSGARISARARTCTEPYIAPG